MRATLHATKFCTVQVIKNTSILCRWSRVDARAGCPRVEGGTWSLSVSVACGCSCAEEVMYCGVCV
jgi:hypothetical protein